MKIKLHLDIRMKILIQCMLGILLVTWVNTDINFQFHIVALI